MNTTKTENTLIPQSTPAALEIPPQAAESATESSTNRKSFRERTNFIELHAHWILQGSLVNANEILKRNDEILNGGKDEFGRLAKHLSRRNRKICLFDVPMKRWSPIPIGHFLVLNNTADDTTTIGLAAGALA